MTRGRIKRILLPYLVRHTLFSLTGASLLFLVFLMLRLVTTLTHEMNQMSDQHQLTTEQVLYYIKNFLALVLFGSLQLFGVYGLVRHNRNILVAYGSSLLVAFIFTFIDHLLSSGYLLIALYLLTQSLFVFLYLYVFPLKRRQISNIHYIPMPNEEGASPQVNPNQKYFRF